MQQPEAGMSQNDSEKGSPGESVPKMKKRRKPDLSNEYSLTLEDYFTKNKKGKKEEGREREEFEKGREIEEENEDSGMNDCGDVIVECREFSSETSRRKEIEILSDKDSVNSNSRTLLSNPKLNKSTNKLTAKNASKVQKKLNYSNKDSEEEKQTYTAKILHEITKPPRKKKKKTTPKPNFLNFQSNTLNTIIYQHSKPQTHFSNQNTYKIHFISSDTLSLFIFSNSFIFMFSCFLFLNFHLFL